MTGQQLIDLAIPHIGQKYSLGALVPKDYKDYAGPWDCAEFTSYLVYQLTGRLYGCANNTGDPAGADAYSGFWGRDAGNLGIRVPVEEAVRTPGSMLLRIASKDIIGHIVVCDGHGGTVEAHSTRTGVIASTTIGRRWDYGVLVPWIDYQANTIIVPVKKPMVYRWTKPMMHGLKIKEIQNALGFRGKEVDGYYGARTFNAVRSFQRNQSLVADGEVGSLTANKLGILI
jgi:N-acetylmuramoyl-L-alanine amidase